MDERFGRLRVKAFNDAGPRVHKCWVDACGVVRVYDSVAGYYTTCHNLSERQQARVRGLLGRWGQRREYIHDSRRITTKLVEGATLDLYSARYADG